VTPGELDEETRAAIADLVLKGEPIPADFKYTLFPPDRDEYELVYAAKEREEDILAETLAVPLQPIRDFGESKPGEWRNQLIFGDNLQATKTLLEMKKSGSLVNSDGQPGIQTIYIDPPFATRRDFGGKDERAFQDKVVGAEFLEFLRKRLILLRELLAPNGSIFVHLDSKKGHYAKVLMDEIFGEHNFRNEIVWHYYNKLQGNVNRLASNHDVIYWYSRSASFPFARLREKRLEGPTRQIVRVWNKDSKSLVNKKGDDGKVLYQETDEKTVDDVWRLSMLQPADRSQNYGYPTQKPEILAARIIEMSTRPGDIVLDAFAGSGTTIAVAEKLGRRWIGIDSGKLAIYTMQKRLLSLKSEVGNKGRALAPKPFTLSNAGLYDFAKLRDLPWKEWRFFALSLFNCDDQPHRVSGIEFDGYRAGSDVLIFNHAFNGGVVLDHGFVDDLHSQLGKRAGSAVYIIAPAASIVFLEDYIDKGETRYYILRIPYSIINELHKRPFEALLQPVNEEEVNRTVDAVGFDFIKQPVVACSYGTNERGAAEVHIQSFVSEALAKGAAQKQDREALAAVLVDFNYPFENAKGSEPSPPFEMNEVHYASQLEANGWKFEIQPSKLGEHAMFVYLDVYGNEYVEVKSKADFAQPTKVTVGTPTEEIEEASA
jgi:DNA modification methylase